MDEEQLAKLKPATEPDVVLRMTYREWETLREQVHDVTYVASAYAELCSTARDAKQRAYHTVAEESSKKGWAAYDALGRIDEELPRRVPVH